MRPASLSSEIDKDRADYTVFCGEWNIGRIYEVRGGPEYHGGFGRCTSRASRSLRTDNRVATLEAAKAEFKASWLSAASTGEKDPARLGEAALAAPAL